jgi:AP-2 complex subunit mu-1
MAHCCAAIYFLNLRGDILIERRYRDDVECVVGWGGGAQAAPAVSASVCVLWRGTNASTHHTHTHTTHTTHTTHQTRRDMAENFRSQILNSKDGSIGMHAPVRTLGSCTFMFLRHSDL